MRQHTGVVLEQLGCGLARFLGANPLVVLGARIDHGQENLLREWLQALGVGAQTLEGVRLALARAHEECLVGRVVELLEPVRVSLLEAALVDDVSGRLAVDMFGVHSDVVVQSELGQWFGCVIVLVSA